jgi:twitching motility protein PilT
MKQQTFDALLLFALSQGASDLHLSAGAPPMIRLNDALQTLSGDALTPEDTLDAVQQLANEDILTRVAATGSMDFSHAIPGRGRFRVSVFKQRGSYALSLRLCTQTLPADAVLGLPDAVKDLAGLKSGLVVLSGAARSGKSTTAAWLISHIAAARPCHIITVEEPIEVLFHHGQGLVNQKEVGLDAPDLQTALAASLREDPDVLYISSANDGETLSLALDAALLGKLVICVVDTPNAAATLQYIIDVARDANKPRVQAQLAEALAAIVSHRLVAARVRKVALFEVLLNSEAIKSLLRENKLYQLNKVIENSTQAGMQTFDLSLAKKVAAQRLSHVEADYAVMDRQKFRQYLLELDR